MSVMFKNKKKEKGKDKKILWNFKEWGLEADNIAGKSQDIKFNRSGIPALPRTNNKPCLNCNFHIFQMGIICHYCGKALI